MAALLAATALPARGGGPSLVLQFSAEPASPRACNPVRWRFQLVNHGAAAVQLRFGSAQRGEIVLRRAGTARYRWSDGRAFTLRVWSRAVASHRSWSFTLKDALPRLAPGRYDLVARVTASARRGTARLTANGTVVVQKAKSACDDRVGADCVPS